MRLRYLRLKEMDPRPGLKYSTTYIIQDASDRKSAYDEILARVANMADALDRDPALLFWFENLPLPDFKTTTGVNRTPLQIVAELLDEFTGVKRDGTPKDIALAPVERWNRLFYESPWAIELEQV